MDIKETIAAALKEIIFPELQELKKDMGELKAGQAAMSARLSDHNAHLMDMSRRLDQMRIELMTEIHQVRTELSGRMDQLDLRLDQTRAELNGRMDQLDLRLDQTRAELNGRMDRIGSELMETNRNIAHLYEVIVRRDDYQQLQDRVARIENQVAELRQKFAA